MTALKEIGECVISVGNDDYFFRPSFGNMSKIGTPEEIVQAFYALHNRESQKLIIETALYTGTVPAWLISYINTSRVTRDAISAAMGVMQACCDTDVSKLVGEIVPGRTGKRAFVWKVGKMKPQDRVAIASSLITHGIIGKAKIRQLQRHESKTTTTEFKAIDYINSARTHFRMSRDDAERLTMTEFILLLNAKYPKQEGFTREEYDAVIDDYFAQKEKRLKRAG